MNGHKKFQALRIFQSNSPFENGRGSMFLRTVPGQIQDTIQITHYTIISAMATLLRVGEVLLLFSQCFFEVALWQNLLEDG
jgi:hypothetical protein